MEATDSVKTWWLTCEAMSFGVVNDAEFSKG